MLDDIESKKFEAWLLERDVSMKCPSCGNMKWTYPYVVNQLVRSGTPLPGEPPSIDWIAIECMNCTGIRLFNAVTAGLGKTGRQKPDRKQGS